jgi:hypothetical protein
VILQGGISDTARDVSDTAREVSDVAKEVSYIAKEVIVQGELATWRDMLYREGRK